MIKQLTIKSFKSLEAVEVDLGQVNVFIGANGSGKSNLLEALGVLSAAAHGRVDDEALLRRGVRPGVPQLYKCALAGMPRPKYISFRATSDVSSYEVSLYNPEADPKPAWRYNTERWTLGEEKIVGRSNATRPKPNPEAGLAALRAVERKPGDPALVLLDLLRDFAIYAPNTPTLRGISPEQQPREPMGLSGGALPQAFLALLRRRRKDPRISGALEDMHILIDWAKVFRSGPASKLPLSASAAGSKQVISFRDRYMAKGRNLLSGYDASEGALYVLAAAVLALDERAPKLLAIDNADHGLNPRLARGLMERMCGWILTSPESRQFLMTTHNPLALDGLPLQDERVRLFTVARSDTGRTVVKRIVVNKKLLRLAEQGWTLSRMWVTGQIGGVPNV